MDWKPWREEEAKQLQRDLWYHKRRLEEWDNIKKFWTGRKGGLVCPRCKADHCEIDGHSC